MLLNILIKCLKIIFTCQSSYRQIIDSEQPFISRVSLLIKNCSLLIILFSKWSFWGDKKLLVRQFKTKTEFDLNLCFYVSYLSTHFANIKLN
jgi:hypothetical protein